MINIFKIIEPVGVTTENDQNYKLFITQNLCLRSFYFLGRTCLTRRSFPYLSFFQIWTFFPLSCDFLRLSTHPKWFTNWLRDGQRCLRANKACGSGSEAKLVKTLLRVASSASALVPGTHTRPVVTTLEFHYISIFWMSSSTNRCLQVPEMRSNRVRGNRNCNCPDS